MQGDNLSANNPELRVGLQGVNIRREVLDISESMWILTCSAWLLLRKYLR